MTGGRLLRLKKILEDDTFLMTYGDSVSNINLKKLVNFHKKNKKIVTLSAVRPPARFGAIKIRNNIVTSFREKSSLDEGWINGGFFVINPKFFKYIRNDKTYLEREPLEQVTKSKQLSAFKHQGFWQCMDTKRDKINLEKNLQIKKIFLMKSILIAGGTGFIGYHLSKKCIKMGWKVTSISSKKPKKKRKIKKVIYVTCSLINKKNIYKKIRKNYDYVVNLSGHVDHKNKTKTLNSHYKSVKNLVEFFISRNKPIKKFIQMGSSAEYGGLTKPQKETAKCVAKSFYGKAKLASTRYLIKQHKLKNFQ